MRFKAIGHSHIWSSYPSITRLWTDRGFAAKLARLHGCQGNVFDAHGSLLNLFYLVKWENISYKWVSACVCAFVCGCVRMCVCVHVCVGGCWLVGCKCPTLYSRFLWHTLMISPKKVADIKKSLSRYEKCRLDSANDRRGPFTSTPTPQVVKSEVFTTSGFEKVEQQRSQRNHEFVRSRGSML